MTNRNIFVNENTFSENGKVYLVTNNTLGNQILLTMPDESFIGFLENLYKVIEIDDYEISSRVLSSPKLKYKIHSALADIFKTTCFDFQINPYLKFSAQFLESIEQILTNHLNTQDLLKNYRLTPSPEKPKDEKPTPKATPIEDKVAVQYQKSVDIRQTNYISTRIFGQNIQLPEITKDNTIKAYNDNDTGLVSAEPRPDNSYSTLESAPISLYSWKAEEDGKVETKSNIQCSILYCHSLNMGIVIENEEVKYVNYLVQNFRDFELVKKYDNINKTELDEIRTYFHKREFETIELITNKISSFENLFDIAKEVLPKDKNALEIEYYIKDNYTLDNEPKNLMKASVILDALILNLRLDCKEKLKLSKEVSAILLKMGLKKKRMADGIYYFGIVAKPSLLNSDENTEERFKKAVEEHKLRSARENVEQLTGGSKK